MDSLPVLIKQVIDLYQFQVGLQEFGMIKYPELPDALVRGVKMGLHVKAFQLEKENH